jgi:hypothetical protein
MNSTSRQANRTCRVQFGTLEVVLTLSYRLLKRGDSRNYIELFLAPEYLLPVQACIDAWLHRASRWLCLLLIPYMKRREPVRAGLNPAAAG